MTAMIEKRSDLRLRVARHRAGALDARLAHARRNLAAELLQHNGVLTPEAERLKTKIEELAPLLERAFEECRTEKAKRHEQPEQPAGSH